ncbi:unnamed protein product [Prorocentrum cordatum]|uniref:Uncharacterized protein n=1 Tax=Prorocentrum cordatum TaxID=2364126 RepID=A0ABN9R8B8_9DINO|nr:unnamed protein product [Polarella glacialis]|mmetsp:Transcript_114055/g.323498  ORF Transcript_114055/g.323498 Transcript_114055/m.323498 type:complete len:239 (-) Transcript_114055:26-742(-)
MRGMEVPSWARAQQPKSVSLFEKWAKEDQEGYRLHNAAMRKKTTSLKPGKVPSRPATPAQVRAKVRKLINKRSMKIKDIQKLMGNPSGWGKFMNGASYKYPSAGAALCNEAYNAASFFFWCEKNVSSRLPPVMKVAKPSLPDISAVKVTRHPLVHIKNTQTALKRICKKYDLTYSKMSALMGRLKFGPRVSVAQISKFVNTGGSEAFGDIAEFCEKVQMAEGQKRKSLFSKLPKRRRV